MVLPWRSTVLAMWLLAWAFTQGVAEEHWAFRPLVRPLLPAPVEAASAAAPVDRFVGMAMARHKLSLSPLADRATLVRCLRNAMRLWIFPEPKGGAADVVYPFRFSNPRF